MAEMILTVKNVKKSFDGFVAVNGVSLSVQKGEICSIIGPNGAGKTTLFNLITRHLPADSGRVTFKGIDISNMPPHKICRLGIGRSFQRTNIFPRLTVFQNIQKEKMTKTRITWLGHASIKIETKGKIIFLDPWLDENPVSTLKVKQVKKADAVCVTHGHIDHIGDSIAIVKATGAPLICTPEIGMYAEKFGGIKYDEGSIPLNIGGSWETADFTITMVNAVHTSDIMGG